MRHSPNVYTTMRGPPQRLSVGYRTSSDISNLNILIHKSNNNTVFYTENILKCCFNLCQNFCQSLSPTVLSAFQYLEI